MAIPFNLPTREETEDSYRVLNQLLVDLYDVLRLILLRQRRLPMYDVPTQPPPRNRPNGGRRADGEERAEQEPEQAAQAEAVALPVLPLPDVVLSAMNPNSAANGEVHTSQAARPQPPPRRARRRRVKTSSGIRYRENWVKVGEDLRKIADEFRATFQEQARKPPPQEANSNRHGYATLLSLLLPAPLRGSLWTAVIFLLGWRLFHTAL